MCAFVCLAGTTPTQTCFELKSPAAAGRILFHGVHHVALLCENLERSLEFYCGILNLEINPDRPHEKLPYRGAWLWIGPEMIHLMELSNPDPLEGRPEHGGRDRHFCVGAWGSESCLPYISPSLLPLLSFAVPQPP